MKDPVSIHTFFSSILALVVALSPVDVYPQSGVDDVCRQGFVWREAYPDDHVCVTPGIRAQTAQDNRQAASRRSPTDRAYGPDTCRQGFVWREVRPDDHTCVTPETRAQVAEDNRDAANRRIARKIRPQKTTDMPYSDAKATALIPSEPMAQGIGVKRGFDENGRPYTEIRRADGTIKRTQQNVVTTIKPDGSREDRPIMHTRSNVQPPTPPELPKDPKSGSEWVQQHITALRAIINALVNGDETEMKKFEQGERKAVGNDPFAQIDYRTRIAEFLARER
jgi:hypothetical protein